MQTTATGVQLYTETPESRAKWAAYRAAKEAEHRAAGLIVDRPTPTEGERRMQLLMEGPAGDDHTVHGPEACEQHRQAVEEQLIREGYVPSPLPDNCPEGSADVVVIDGDKADRLAYVIGVARRRGLKVTRCRRTGGWRVEASTIADRVFRVSQGACECPGFGHKGMCVHVGAVVAYLADHEGQPPPAAPISVRRVLPFVAPVAEEVSHAA